jgi:hypothetical protein
VLGPHPTIRAGLPSRIGGGSACSCSGCSCACYGQVQDDDGRRASPPERRARRGARSGGVGVRPPRAGQRGPGTYRSKMRQQLSLPDVRLAPIPTPNSIGFGPLRPSPPHAVAEAPLPRQPRILAQQPEPRIGAPWRIRGIGRSEPTPISARAGSNL